MEWAERMEDVRRDSRHVLESMDSVSLEAANPRLLEARFVPEQQLRFDAETGLSMPRMVREYEVVMFLQDGGWFYVNGVQYPILRNCVRFHKPGDLVVSHKYRSIYVFHFSLSGAPGRYAVCPDLQRIPTQLMPGNPARVLSLCEEMVRAKLYEETIDIKFRLWEMLRLLLSHGIARRDAQLPENLPEAVRKAAEYIQTQYAKRLTLDMISAAAFLHPNYFHRLFTRSVGLTPLAYVTDVRLRHAREMLITGNLRVAEIGRECGFETPSYFIKQFRRAYGLPPGQFRERETIWPDGGKKM